MYAMIAVSSQSTSQDFWNKLVLWTKKNFNMAAVYYEDGTKYLLATGVFPWEGIPLDVVGHGVDLELTYKGSYLYRAVRFDGEVVLLFPDFEETPEENFKPTFDYIFPLCTLLKVDAR